MHPEFDIMQQKNAHEVRGVGFEPTNPCGTAAPRGVFLLRAAPLAWLGNPRLLRFYKVYFLVKSLSV
jgi:hypothetical protein